MRRLPSSTLRAWAVLAGLALLAACAPPPAAEVPQATVAPTEAASAVPAASATPPPTATADAAATAATSTPDPGSLTLDWSSTSPDGQWTASGFNAGLHSGEAYYVRLRVEGAAGAQVWTPVDEWRPMGLGYTLPALFKWSDDGQRLFFTNLPHPDGCGPFVNGDDLHVLDLATGVVTELMPSRGLRLALSPDEARLAYIGYGDRGLIVRDLATGQEDSISVEKPTEAAVFGALQWSPEGTALALTAAHDPCGGATRSILHVDLATGTVRTLVEADPSGLETIAWPQADLIHLRDQGGAEWLLDVATGAVTPL